MRQGMMPRGLTPTCKAIMILIRERTMGIDPQSQSPQIIEARFGSQFRVLLLVLGLVFCGSAIGSWSGPGACLGAVFALAGCGCLYISLSDLLRPRRVDSGLSSHAVRLGPQEDSARCDRVLRTDLGR